jgi:serine/threonine protein kinase
MVFEFRQFRLSDFVTAFGYPDYEGKKTILKGVLNGISHLHQQNIIHGNLSFSNIYLAYTAEK